MIEFVKKCKACNSENLIEVINLGLQPIANNLMSKIEICQKIPLVMNLCQNCKLGQLSHFVDSKHIFSEYKYLSSTSSTWLEHSSKYVDLVIKRLNLNTKSKVIEVACNDGYLLNFFRLKKFDVLGIEPAKNVAKIAMAKGIPTKTVFLTSKSAKEIVYSYGHANLVVANNVLAHVPDIKDFVFALKTLIMQDGIITIENPSLLNLLKNGLFDTVYHEHYSYLSATSVVSLFNSIGLEVFDIDELDTHGGSLRYWIANIGVQKVSQNVNIQLLKENFLDRTKLINLLESFRTKSINAINGLRDWIQESKNVNARLVGYGAAAKSTVVLNTVGPLSSSLLGIVDNNPEKQGYFLPGIDIPIIPPEAIYKLNPTDILIFPWNLSQEIHMNIRNNLKLDCNVWIWSPKMQKI